MFGVCLSEFDYFDITSMYGSMITVVEFGAKQATGSRYMSTDKLNGNYFFVEIDLD